MSTRPIRNELIAAMFHELRRTVAGTVLFNQRMATLLKVNPTDLQFLNLLELYGSLTPGRLADLSGLTTGGVTVVLDRMEKAGVIRRAANPDDRRSSIIHADEKFLRTARAAYSKRTQATDKLLAGFSDSELRTVVSFLKKANDARV
jgi:MarR family transcriptional regulator, organic hydroperoxide resistance regulator